MSKSPNRVKPGFARREKPVAKTANQRIRRVKDGQTRGSQRKTCESRSCPGARTTARISAVRTP